jgi:phosphoribosylanthranilate isomerase
MASKETNSKTIKPSSFGEESKKVRLKICGMNKNTAEVAALEPDYLGFIFWEGSKRNFEGDMPNLSTNIKKIGVFVDAPLEEVRSTIKTYDLDGVQLHGNESPEYCQELRPVRFSKPVRSLEIIKVFSIKDEFDFSVLAPFEAICDYFLFDTKGKLPGGNGYVFDWSLLKEYPSTKPYFLSGGIGLENSEEIKVFLESPEAKYCYAIDVNSKFEVTPGLKKIEELTAFKKVLSN